MASLWKLFSFSARAGALGGAVYLTASQGVWSSSNQTGARALQDFRERVIPTTNDAIKQIPNGEQLTQAFKLRWNSGVEWTANKLAALPSATSRSAKGAASSLMETIRPTGDK